MICSELTNIRYRGDLRGKVDALFVSEWNPDTDTFSSLIESSALDIHAFMIQSNNRTYGNSRILMGNKVAEHLNISAMHRQSNNKTSKYQWRMVTPLYRLLH